MSLCFLTWLMCFFPFFLEGIRRVKPFIQPFIQYSCFIFPWIQFSLLLCLQKTMRSREREVRLWTVFLLTIFFNLCLQIKHSNKGNNSNLSLKTSPQDMQMFIYILYLSSLSLVAICYNMYLWYQSVISSMVKQFEYLNKIWPAVFLL